MESLTPMDHRELIRQIELSLPQLTDYQSDAIYLTDIQRDLLNLISSIPRGKLVTIGDIATTLGVNTTTVSWICRMLTNLDYIPFHRVVRSGSASSNRKSVHYLMGNDGRYNAPMDDRYRQAGELLRSEGVNVCINKHSQLYVRGKEMDKYRYSFK